MKEFAMVSWCWKDIQHVRKHWTREKCEEFLLKHEDKIADLMIENGWFTIHDILGREE